MFIHFFSAAFLIAAGLASAHLGAVTSPKQGDMVAAGAKVTITWTSPNKHQGIDLALSVDGKTWSPITTSSLGSSVTSYQWTVPNTSAEKARVRVCQRDGSGTLGCTDDHNSNALSVGIPRGEGEVYVSISKEFAITGSSPVLHSAPRIQAQIRPNLDYRTVDVSFDLPKGENVSLVAYDMQGKLVATLMDEARPEGPNNLSVFSNALDARRAMIFKLHVGGRLATQTWSAR